MNVNIFGGDYEVHLSALGAGDNSVLYTSGDVSKKNYHIIENESGQACDIYVSVDGTNFSTAATSVRLIDEVITGGGIMTIDIPDNKIGILRGKFKKIRVLMKGAGTPAAGLVRIAHGCE